MKFKTKTMRLRVSTFESEGHACESIIITQVALARLKDGNDKRDYVDAVKK